MFSPYVRSDDVQASLPPLTPFEADDNNDCSTSDASRTTLKNYSGDQVVHMSIAGSQFKLFIYIYNFFFSFSAILLNFVKSH